MTDHLIRGQAVQEEKKSLSLSLRRNATLREQTLWQELRGRRLAGWKFRRQQVIDGFVVDFYCDEAKLVVEVDGGVHGTQQEYDLERNEHMAQRGLRVLRFQNEEVANHLEEVLKKITENLIPRPPSPIRRRGRKKSPLLGERGTRGEVLTKGDESCHTQVFYDGFW